MKYAYSCDQVRQLEAAAIARVGADTLMQRAADGLARQAIRLLQQTRGTVYGARVLLLIGPGNNGGDALFAGERLARRGCQVQATPAIGRPHRAGLAALLAAGGGLTELAELAGLVAFGATGIADFRAQPNRFDRAPDLVVDGLLGIGGRPGLPAPVAELVRALAAAELPIISVDLPSGVAADTGQVPQAAVAATQTVTFGSYKPCHLVTPAAEYAGAVTVVDIGLQTQPDPAAESVTPMLAGWEAAGVAARWPVPGSSSDKYSRGVVGINTGSAAYPGAGVLSTLGAVYGGAGMVRFCGDPESAALIKAELPNVVFGPGRCQTWLAGSGWGERPDGATLIADLLAQVGAASARSAISLVIDADGLRYLPETAAVPTSDIADRVLLTPHDGELARLLGRTRAEIVADRIAAVQQGADATGATVLLKGATQLVATPGGGTIEVAVRGPAWTGQAGSGDVLGGLCAALLAAGLPAKVAAVLGASVQAMAAASSTGPIPPQDLARRCAELIGSFAGVVGGFVWPPTLASFGPACPTASHDD